MKNIKLILLFILTISLTYCKKEEKIAENMYGTWEVFDSNDNLRNTLKFTNTGENEGTVVAKGTTSVKQYSVIKKDKKLYFKSDFCSGYIKRSSDYKLILTSDIKNKEVKFILKKIEG